MKLSVFYLKVTLLLSIAYCGKVKIKKKGKSFLVGRIPPGQFEYPELNGFYTPKEAQKVCDEDLQCAGFSFKGKINHKPVRCYIL